MVTLEFKTISIDAAHEIDGQAHRSVRVVIGGFTDVLPILRHTNSINAAGRPEKRAHSSNSTYDNRCKLTKSSNKLVDLPPLMKSGKVSVWK